jgi:amidase
MINRSYLVARLILGFCAISCLSGCSALQRHSRTGAPDHAFIVYWPPPENSKQLRLAVKDLIDMKGVVTTAGSEYVATTSPPASQDAQCLELARERNVQIVGKTNLTEFAATVSGKNEYFGTPRNRLDGKHKFIPGGSSSGSAVAVETGMADVAFGTDTGGSIRLPAACCGILGLKTTFGLVPIKGVFPLSPKHLDTVGPMAKDMTHLVQGMDLLQRGFAARYERAVAAEPSAKDIRIGRLYVDGTNPAIDKALDDALAAKRFKVTKLDQAFKAKWDQAQKDGKTVAFADLWFHDQKYTDKNGVSGTAKAVINQGEREYTNNYKDALKRQAAWQHDLRKVFEKVDFIALPTLQNLPPKFPFFGSSVVFELLVFNMQNTTAVNFAGNPALAMPIPMPAKGKTVPVTSLQLVGPRLSEAELLNAGRLIESKH